MEYDLTARIAPYLDRHLVFPLLGFLESDEDTLYDPKGIQQAKLDLLSETNMIDFAIEIYRELHNTEDSPEELLARREDVIVYLQTLREECSPFLHIFDDQNLLQELQEKKLFNMQHLGEKFGVTEDTLECLYDYSKFQFDCGNYSASSEYLNVYRLLQPNRPDREFSALWGIFAGDILMQSWDSALKVMNELKDMIDSMAKSGTLNPLQVLQQRSWLIHWGLFVFFNHPHGRNLMIEMIFQGEYLNTIQTNCPHILRYLTMAVITNKRRRNVLKDLVRVIQQEQYTYHDPITEFVECLYVNFDFEGAQNMLQNCENTVKHDYFLKEYLEEFVENARLTIFEIYCRIHKCIDIEMLAQKLNMDRDSAERWIVNLIRNARLDAKIDSQQNQVLMGVNVPSVHEQVVESTKALLIRSNVLVQSISRGVVATDGGYRGYWRGGRGDRRQ
mmetsp:Transcript_12100/g.36895  ORF Transcript_12100/g.36895 Transcript_12100/m.36895 type:complete len:446 (+) Transcript_12100:102-1439(+)